MAKGFALDIETQISSARGRMAFGRVDGVDLIETNMRLVQLHRSLQAIGSSGDSELFRHFPVAAIAVLEGHFKATVAAIVNADPTYLERGISLAKDKLKSAADVLPLLHRKSVTIGDLVAYVLPFSSVANIENAFNALLDGDLKNMIADARDPYEIRNERPDPERLVSSVANLWRDLALAFERRHILAHEAATKFEISYEDANSAIDACSTFTNALDSVLWATVWKDTPLTQYEMNMAARQGRNSARLALAADLRKAFAAATKDGEREWFRRMHLAWKKFSMEWQEREVSRFEGGSMRPLIFFSSQERALVARREAIRNWLNLKDPEAASD